jgi:hypothetical protein
MSNTQNTRYNGITFSNTAIESVLRGIRDGSSNEFEQQYFADDPEMLAFVIEQQQKRANGRENDQQAAQA